MDQKEDFHKTRQKISSVKQTLTSLSQEKETAYQQIKTVHDKIKVMVTKIRDLKAERDALTQKVQQLKDEREKLNNEVKEKAGQKKEADKAKPGILQVPQEDPSSLKAQIKRLEEKIETEVMPFDKEQKLTKMIKELKDKLLRVSGISDAWKKIKEVTTEFSKTKKSADRTHHEIQMLAKESQEKHEQLNALYKELKMLREEEKPLSQKYGDLKASVGNVQNDMKKLQAIIRKHEENSHHEREKRFDVKVQQKTQEVQEKIRKGKKLNTEDILAFQASKEDS